MGGRVRLYRYICSCISRVMTDLHMRACRMITEAWLANYVALGSNVTFLIGTVGYTSTPPSRSLGFKFVAHRLRGARACSLLRITGPAVHHHFQRNILFLNWIDQFKPLVVTFKRSEFIQLLLIYYQSYSNLFTSQFLISYFNHQKTDLNLLLGDLLFDISMFSY